MRRPYLLPSWLVSVVSLLAVSSAAQVFNQAAPNTNVQALQVIGTPSPGATVELRVLAPAGACATVFIGTESENRILSTGITLLVEPSSVIYSETSLAGAGGMVSLMATFPPSTPSGQFFVCQSCIIYGDGTLNLTNRSTVVTQDMAITPPAVPSVAPVQTPTAASQVQVTGAAANAGDTILITGGAAPVSVVANGGPAGNAFSGTVTLTPNSLNSLFVTEIFAAGGMSAPVAAPVVQDGQAPSLFIDFPANGSQLTLASATIAGRVGDLLSGFMGLSVIVSSMPSGFSTAANVDVGVGTLGTYDAPSVPLALGNNVITAVATDALGNTTTRTISLTRVQPAGQQMTVLSGNNQTGAVTSTLTNPIQVFVSESNGTPVANKTVTFQISLSNGMLSNGMGGPEAQVFQTQTDASGVARATWRLGNDAGCGNNRVVASATNVSGTVFFCASAVPGPASRIAIGSGNDQSGEVGTALGTPLRVYVHDGNNGIPGVAVTFSILIGNGTFPLSGPTRVVTTNATGHAETDFVLGSNPGNNVIQATFAANTEDPVAFRVTGRARTPGMPTVVSGRVLDNAFRPLRNVTCELSFAASPQQILTVLSAADGTFVFDSLPTSGPATLHIDGATATEIGGMPVESVPSDSFPGLEIPLIVLAETVNGPAMPILLPRLDPQNSRSYDGTADVDLTVAGLEGLRLRVKAGSMRLRDGSLPNQANPAVISLNQVHTDKVPMPVPDGTSPRFAWTLQPAGATFNPPVEVSFPNTNGLPPGAITYFLSFDHGTNRFEIVASGRVTPDGSRCVSDPGSGIFEAGWGGQAPPPPPRGKNCDCTGKPNGCGSADFDVPEAPFLGIVSFTAACNTHDTCYSTHGASKAACDAIFFLNMSVACATQLPPIITPPQVFAACEAVAFAYYLGVAFGGGSAYDAAQQAAWECLQQCNAGAVAAGPMNPPTPQPPAGWSDTDGDFIPDSFESANGLDPNDPSDAHLDPDGDGLDNFDEFAHMTDPQNADTDGNGTDDGIQAAMSQPVRPDVLGDTYTVTVGGRMAPVSVIGTYFVSDIPITGEPIRASFVGTRDGAPRYAKTEFFQLLANQTYHATTVSIADTPFPAPLSLSAVVSPNILTSIGQTAQVNVMGNLSDGTTAPLNTLADGTTYTSSNPAIVSIAANGVVTAQSAGSAFITIRNQGVTGVVSVLVLLGQTTLVEGEIVDASGQPVGGATVNVVASTFVTGTDGQVSFALPVTVPEVVATASKTMGTMTLFGQSMPVTVIAGGITDIGTIVIDIDSDGDGLPDWYEINVYGSNPALADTDGDGLNDGFEAFALGSNPNSTDSDGDGFDDAFEVQFGTDPGSFDSPTTIIGRALRPDGMPASGATARLLNAPVGVYSVMTDANGDFVMPPWPAALTPINVAVQLGQLFGASGPTATIVGATTNVGVISLEAPGTIFPSPQFDVGDDPRDITVADMNGDGLPDLLTADRASASITVLLGIGDSTVASGQSFNVASMPISIASGDLNGDGHQDVVTVHSDLTARVHPGNGTGTLGSSSSIPAMTAPLMVEVAEVTNDGHLDLVILGTTNIVILAGNGMNGFGPPTFVSTGSGTPRTLAIGDLNGDGRLDLVVGYASGVNVGVSFALPSGGFAPLSFVGAGLTNPAFVAVDRIDGNASLDIIVASSTTTGATVLANSGTGSFALATTLVTSTSARGIDTGDFDADGDNDIVVALGSHQVHVVINLGGGVFSTPALHTVGLAPQGVITVDLDLDGSDDIAAVNSVSDSVSVLIARGDGTFPPNIDVTMPTPQDVVAADFDQDGNIDLVASTSAGNSIRLFLGIGDGTFSAGLQYSVGMTPRDLTAFDTDFDGLLDIVVANTGSNSVSILRNLGGGIFAAAQNVMLIGSPAAVAIGFLNADQVPDMAIAMSNPSTNNIVILLGLGGNVFGPPVAVSSLSLPSDIAISDTNQDGVNDLLVTSRGTDALSIQIGNGNGTFGPSTMIPVGVDPTALAVANLDGDSFLDAMVASRDRIYVLFGGPTTFLPAILVETPGLTSDIDVGDFNADGQPDLAVVRLIANSVGIALNLGNRVFAPLQSFSAGGAVPQRIAIDDLDGDSLPDIAVTLPALSNLSILLNQIFQ